MEMNKPIVVDSHHHFWDPTRARYPWMTDDLAAVRRPFGPDDLRPDLVAAGVDYTVLIQTRSSEEETRAFMAIAAGTPFIAGVVGWVDLTAPDVADRLAALKVRPDGTTLVGIRHQVHDEPDARWLLRDDVRRGLRAVRDASLAYDLLVRTRELPAALETVHAFPDLRVVIDHVAKPPIRSGEIEAWAAALAPFKEQDRVYCKLSGMVTEASWRDWTLADLQPYIDRVVDIFGEDRLMFGSDWPVCLLAATYTTVYATLCDALRGLPPSARDKIFGANAIKFYQLNVLSNETSSYNSCLL
jgi:L-fuconolactonase